MKILIFALPGLAMDFYIEQDEFDPLIRNYAGIKVVLHNPNELPFPEDEGVLVGPGEWNSISIRKVGQR